MMVMDELQVRNQIQDNLEIQLLFHELLVMGKNLVDGLEITMYEQNEIIIH
jgi:hypothetical protein